MARDLRYAGRILRKSPVFASVAVLTLGIGIGTNSTVFSWIEATLLNPLPGASDPQKVAALESLTPSGGGCRPPTLISAIFGTTQNLSNR